MNIIADEPEQYKAWISKQKTIVENATAHAETERGNLLVRRDSFGAEEKK